MEQEITLKEAWQQILSYEPAVWCGVASAIIVFIIEIILCKKQIIFSGVEKKIQEAKTKGNVIKAYRTNCRYNDKNSKDKTANRMWIAMYEYEIDGVKSKKQIISTSIEPPLTINLYYTNNSKKVLSEYDGGKNPLQILLYIIPVLVAFVVMKLFGFKFN